MCRNIKPLFNFEPPASADDMHASALQYVRKVSGYNKPSKVNEDAFNRAVTEIAAITRELMATLVTDAAPRDRQQDIARRKERAAKRYG
jgi:hypothetical protein